MSGIMDIIVRAQDLASDVLEQVAGAGEGMGGRIEDALVPASLALGAAGAAAEGLVRSQQGLHVSTRQLAARIGENEGAVRDWATSMSDAGFTLDDAVELMDLASRRGLEGREALMGYAGFWDTISDATGESAVALARAGVGLQGIGIAAGSEGQALDAFGFIMDNTTQEVGDFLTFIERTGPDLRAMGVDVDDTAALLGVLENELGLTGRTARTEFNSAISSSDGTLEGLLAELGISEAQFREYRDAVDGAGSAVERNAAITNDSFTPLQQLQAWLADVTFGFSDFIAGSEALGTWIGALASAPVIIIAAKGAWAGLMAAMALGPAVIGSVSAALAFLAANPIVAIILIIAALVAGLVWLWQNNETFRDIVSAVWGFVADVIGAIAREVGGYFGNVVAGVRILIDTFVWLRDMISAVWTVVGAVVGGAVGWLGDRFADIGRGIDNVIGFFRRMRDMVVGFVRGLVDTITAPIRFAQGLINSLNPFAKHSPSLVENVQAGVRMIAREYASLSDMQLSGPTLAPAGMPVLGSSALGGPLVHIEHYSGGEEEDERLARYIEHRIGRQ